MKTAISIPDEVYRVAEDFARSRKLSRSKLFARAVAEYVSRHRQENVTEQLNKVYEKESSAPDPVMQKIAAKSLAKEKW